MVDTMKRTITPTSGFDAFELFDGQDARITNQDKLDMRRMGKSQELKRYFVYINCSTGSWETILTVNTQGLVAGGLAGLFWSLVWAYAGQAFVVLSLAEMTSIAPTAGGQYHWVFRVRSQKVSENLELYIWMAVNAGLAKLHSR